MRKDFLLKYPLEEIDFRNNDGYCKHHILLPGNLKDSPRKVQNFILENYRVERCSGGNYLDKSKLILKTC